MQSLDKVMRDDMTEIFEIDNKTWRIENEFVRFFLVEGEEKAVLIDSGFNCTDARSIVESLTRLPIMLLNTHGDGDHISGTGAFDTIYMSAEDFSGCGVADRFPEVRLEEVNDNDLISLGGRTLKIVKIPGHTYGSIAIIDIENRYLFSGDSVQDGQIFMFGDHRSPEQFRDSLLKLKGLAGEFEKIYPSHSTVMLENDYIDKVIESWDEVQSGNLEYSVTELHGSNVKAYNAKWCGFFCS